MEVATIFLTLKDEKSEKHYTLDIAVHAPELEILNCIMDDSVLGDGDHIADPGETFNLIYKIRNLGSSDVGGQFTIASSDPTISVLEPGGKSGFFRFGEITEIPIMVKLSETAASGSFISVTSTLNCNPYFVNMDFSFRVGQIRESFEASSFNVFSLDQSEFISMDYNRY